MDKLRHLVRLLALLLPFAAGAQGYTVVMTNGTTTVNGLLHPNGIIYDDGGANDDYSNSFNGSVVITAAFGDTIHLWGSYNTESSYDVISVYDGGGTGVPVATHSGSGSVNVNASSGSLTLSFHSDASLRRSGFELHYEVLASGCSNAVRTLSASFVKATELDLSWQAASAGGPFSLRYGSVDTVVVGSSHHIRDLSPLTTYNFVVSSVADSATPSCSRSLTVMTTSYSAEVLRLRSFCGDSDTVWLTAALADHYFWSTGDTARTIGVTDTGSYYLVAYTGAGNSIADTEHFTIDSLEFEMDMFIPSALCPGETTRIYVGYNTPATVRVHQGESTLSEAARVFLPDGVYCPPHGCSYRSELEFSGFSSTARITNVNDIRYVMLNMEHSFAGDLYINITCPNSQSADILRYGGTGHSDCNSTILASSRGWRGDNLASTGTYFGDAYDMNDSSSPCDSTESYNAPGTGWRYCWSNCQDAGYQYAPGDGIIYRTWNVGGSGFYGSFDSSNVAQGTQFYHPDDSFTNLIGCPMNGTWYIEVIDGWSSDNGYIFGWELALNPNRLVRRQYHFDLSYADLYGPFATRVNDTVFDITAPHLAHDTLVQYRLVIRDSLGCSYDTTFDILFRATAYKHVFDTIVENQAASWSYNGVPVHHDTTNMLFTFSRAEGCDSLVYYNLHVWPNSDTTILLRYCADEPRPYDHDTTLVLLNHHGADSIVHYHVVLLPAYHYEIYDTICDNAFRLFGGDTLVQPGTYTLNGLTQDQCDSTYVLHLVVNPTYNFEFTDTLMYGHSVTFEGYELTEPGEYVYRYTSSQGCDSLRTLHLLRHSIVERQVKDSICEGDTMYFYDLVITQGGTYYDTAFSDILSKPDTLVLLTLVEVPHPAVAIDSAFICGDSAQYILTAITEVEHVSWRYPGLQEPVTDSVLYLPNPGDAVTVTLTADYREEPLCPSVATLALTPIKVLDAVIEARPTLITGDNRDLKAYNRSRGQVDNYFWRVYYDDLLALDGEAVNPVQVTPPLNLDSVVFFLYVENEMCQDSDRVVVDVLGSDILFPNVITPTQATNQYFRGYSTSVTEYELWIFDRRGDVVFHTTDINQGWNGVSKGHESEQEAFAYKCRYRTELINGWQTKIGTVTVLR